MPRNITRGEVKIPAKPFNPMGNPDPNYGKSEDPIKAHYEFGQFYRIIVKKHETACNYRLFVERKILNALNEEVWTTVCTTEFVEPEDIYAFDGIKDTVDSVTNVLKILAGILLYKRQDLLVDKMEAKPNA